MEEEKPRKKGSQDEIYFRGLLLRYINHVEQVTGNDFIEFGIGSLDLLEVGFDEMEISALKKINRQRRKLNNE